MKRIPTLFLQAVIVLVGIGTLAFLLWEPTVEGRNVHATLVEVYFHDPFLTYAYAASIPFFVVLYQAFTVVGHVRRNTLFSQAAIQSLRTIQSCAIAMILFVAVGEMFILLGNGDDLPPAVAMGVLITLGSLVIAATAAVCERVVQDAVGGKSRLASIRR